MHNPNWTNNFLTYRGWFRWTIWDETQAFELTTMFFKWRARRYLEKYADKLYANH